MRGPSVRILLALALVAGLGGARQALAQSAYGYSGLVFNGTSQNLYSYSMTDLDYVAQAYYGVVTDAYLYAGNNIVSSSAGTTNGGYVYLYYPTSIDTSYWVQTNHWVYPIAGGPSMPNFSCVVPEWYVGSFGVSACGTGSSGMTYIGTSYASGDTSGSGPSISSLDQTSYGTAQTGTSGYLIIYGSNLTNLNFGSTSVMIGDGISTSLTYVGQNQLNVYYTIPPGAAPGGQTLTVTTPYGYTTGTFQVYPISITTPTISGGNQGFPFQNQLWAAGGEPPYTWSVAPGSSLPAGLTLTATNGFLGGTPTVAGNAFSFTIQVTDSLGATATQTYTIAIQGFMLGPVGTNLTGVAGGYDLTVNVPVAWSDNFDPTTFFNAPGTLFGNCGTSGGPGVSVAYSFGDLVTVFSPGLYSGGFSCVVGAYIGTIPIQISFQFNVHGMPTITSIQVDGAAVTGDSGYIAIYGQYLDNPSGNPLVSLSGSGATVTGIEYASPSNPNQINVYYSVDPSASPGPRTLTVNTVYGTATTTTDVLPAVTISGSPGVALGGTSSYSVTLSAPSSSEPIEVDISTASGTGNATFEDGTTSQFLTSSSTLVIAGAIVSNTAGNISLLAKPQQAPRSSSNSKRVLATQSVSVVNVTITMNNTGTVSNDDDGLDAYFSLFGTKVLGPNVDIPVGPFGATGPPPASCGNGVEFVGQVVPNNYPGSITLRRTIASGANYGGSTLLSSSSAYAADTDDTSTILGGSYPRSSPYQPGMVYDLDNPSIGSNTTGSIVRQRVNLQEYAVLGNRFSTNAVGNTLSWWARSSCLSLGPGNGTFSTDVSGDNQSGTGTTNVTWNLQ